MTKQLRHFGTMATSSCMMGIIHYLTQYEIWTDFLPYGRQEQTINLGWHSASGRTEWSWSRGFDFELNQIPGMMAPSSSEPFQHCSQSPTIMDVAPAQAYRQYSENCSIRRIKPDSYTYLAISLSIMTFNIIIITLNTAHTSQNKISHAWDVGRV